MATFGVKLGYFLSKTRLFFCEKRSCFKKYAVIISPRPDNLFKMLRVDRFPCQARE